MREPNMHSVGLDECHEMLINKHAVVKPSKEHLNQITKYNYSNSCQFHRASLKRDF